MKQFLATVIAFLVCWQAGKAFAPKPQDSVGIAQKNGIFYIIHQVENRQTLFALSKIYKVSIQEILEANTGMPPAVQNGQLLYVPLKNFKAPSGTVFSSIENGKLMQGDGGNATEPKAETTPVVPPTTEKLAPQPKQEKKEDKPKATEPKQETEKPADNEDKFNWSLHYGTDDVYHEVKAGETLYKIAAYYGLSVSELMSLNDLETSIIEVGQKLLVRKGKIAEQPAQQPVAPKPQPKEEKKEPQPKPVTTQKPVEEEKPVAEEPQTGETKEVKETGFAMIIGDDFPNKDKNIVLHTNARVGTVILLTNPANGKTVYVRVVGKLQTDDSGILLMISPEAAQTLGIKPNAKAKLNLSYAQ